MLGVCWITCIYYFSEVNLFGAYKIEKKGMEKKKEKKTFEKNELNLIAR